MLRRRALAALVPLSVVLTAGLAACSSSEAPEAPAQTAAVDDAAVNQARYECLLDQGLAVTRSADGAVEFLDPEGDQQDAWDAAETLCTAQLVDAGLLAETSPDQLSQEYALLTALHTCLVDAGFPLVDWPSEEVFVQGDGAFDATESTVPLDDAAARKACPDEYRAVNSA